MSLLSAMSETSRPVIVNDEVDEAVETAGLVEPGDLWRTTESKSSSLPSGISLARVEEALNNEKNSPCPSTAASPPEKDKVDPAKGDPVAETTPEVKVD